MSISKITEWKNEYSSNRITARSERGVLETDPSFPYWGNLVSQRVVRGIAIDPHSQHMWIATWGGVLSWNRREEGMYRRYSSEHGLAGNDATCICIDSGGRPWVGHREGGLSTFVGNRWQTFSGHQELISKSILAVCSAGQQGGIWIAAEDALYYVSGFEGSTVPIASHEDSIAQTQTLRDFGSGVFVGNHLGLFLVQRSGARPQQIAENTIRACVVVDRDSKNQVWVGTPETVFRLDGTQAIKVAGDPPIGRIRAIAAGNNRVWVLTTTTLAFIENDTWISVASPEYPIDFSQFHVLAVGQVDRSVWIGSNRHLISVDCTSSGQANWFSEILTDHPEDELNNLGRCILPQAESDRVWIGTAGGLVDAGPDGSLSIEPTSVGDVRMLCSTSGYSAKRESLWMLNWPFGVKPLIGKGHKFSGLPSILTSDREGCPHVIVGGALWKVSNSPIRLSDSATTLVRCLAQTADGVWWIGTTQGLFWLDGTGWRLAGEQPGPVSAEIYGLIARSDTLWVASSSGLWSRQGNIWHSHPVKGPQVYALAPARVPNVWWLAQENGIARYDSSSNTSDLCFTTQNSGLASYRVIALLEHSGTLWIVTMAGTSYVKLQP